MLSAGLILFLAALQGVTELFPVSSLGHAVVVPPLIGLNFQESSAAFVPVLAVLHLGTAAALLFLYRRDWVRIVVGFFRAAVQGRIGDPDQRLAIMLIIGSVPAGIIGFLLQDPLKSLFADPRAASAFLIVNGGILFAAEMFRRRDERRIVELREVGIAIRRPKRTRYEIRRFIGARTAVEHPAVQPHRGHTDRERRALITG